MRFDEAKQLLMAFGALAPNKEDAEISSLIEELQSLPLAIMQAGTYMSRTSTTPKEYLALLAQSKKRWDILKTDDMNRHRRLNVPNNVLETWTISITRIRRESEMTYKTLHVIAYVSNENIPHEMIITTLGHIDKNLKNDADLLEPEAVKVITRLKEFSFIGIRHAEDGSKSYEMHKLVQEAIRYGLSVRKPSIIMVEGHLSIEERHTQRHGHKIPPKLKGFTERKAVEESIEATSVGDTESEKYFSTVALHVSSEHFLESRPDTWKQCENYISHALQVAEWADVNEQQIETAQLLSKASWFLHERGRWKEKEQVDKKVLKYRQEWLGDSHLDTIQAIANLAMAYHHQGRYKESEKFHVRVLYQRREILGDEHPGTIAAMANLALTYNKQGRYSESESLQIQVLDYQREIFGARHPLTIRAMGNLAATYHGQGQYDKSELLHIQALNAYQEILGARHLDTIRAMGNLAATYNKQGRYSESESLQVQVLDCQREILGARHSDTIRTMANLSITYYQQGRYNEAELLRVQALDLRREIFGDKHPHTIQSMRILANTWHAMGRREQAIALMQQALEYSRSTLGANHPQIVLSTKALERFES